MVYAPLFPSFCNLCGREVIYEPDPKMNSGYRYRCVYCGAKVGTNPGKPKEALGLLARADIGSMRAECHRLFDERWQHPKGPVSKSVARNVEYARLAKYLGIMTDDCHFSKMDAALLEKALEYLKS